MKNPSVAVLVSFIVAAATLGISSVAVAEPVGLSERDKALVEEYLGDDFLGPAVVPPVIGAAEEFVGLTAQQTVLRFIDVNENEEWTATFHRDGPKDWRIDYSNGDVRHGEFLDNGGLLSLDLKDADEDVVTITTPPDPFFESGLQIGKPEKQRLSVTMVEADDREAVKYEGYLDVTYEYLGAHRVTVPAGTFDAAVLRWEYDGKVGPAEINDQQYYFIAEGVGPVAIIENKQIVAMVVYRKSMRLTGLLLERK